jgi:hypothetical protein
MRDFAEQIFVGALIELVSLVLTYLFKEKLHVSIAVFGAGTILAGIVAFSPTTVTLPVETEPINNRAEITVASIPLETEDTLLTVGVTQTIETQMDVWSGVLVVRMPTLNEIRAEIPISLWDVNLLDVRDMRGPGTDVYSGEAQNYKEYLFPVYWCAATADLLSQNMDHIIQVNLNFPTDRPAA